MTATTSYAVTPPKKKGEAEYANSINQLAKALKRTSFDVRRMSYADDAPQREPNGFNVTEWRKYLKEKTRQDALDAEQEKIDAAQKAQEAPQEAESAPKEENEAPDTPEAPKAQEKAPKEVVSAAEEDSTPDHREESGDTYEDYRRFFEFKQGMEPKNTILLKANKANTVAFEESRAVAELNNRIRNHLLTISAKKMTARNEMRSSGIVDTKDLGVKLCKDAWTFGVTAIPHGEGDNFAVVSPDAEECAYLCAIQEPAGISGVINYSIVIQPRYVNGPLRERDTNINVRYSFSMGDEVRAFFLPKAVASESEA